MIIYRLVFIFSSFITSIYSTPYYSLHANPISSHVIIDSYIKYQMSDTISITMWIPYKKSAINALKEELTFKGKFSQTIGKDQIYKPILIELHEQFKRIKNNIPFNYQQQIEFPEQATSLFDGFRIQLVSSERVNQADSSSIIFNNWTKNTRLSYIPKLYITFKPPYYRVHIGDFRTHEQADQFLSLIRPLYPYAWVVYAHIDASLIPRTDKGQLMMEFLNKP